MKVKDLIEKLKTMDPEAAVLAHEYDGSDDAPREIESVTQRVTKDVPEGEWPSTYDASDKTDPWKPLKPKTENVVLLSSYDMWHEAD